MKIRRLALTLLAIPCAFAIYACSGDDDDNPATDTDAGPGVDTGGGGNPDTGGGGSDSGNDSGKTDAGDGGIKDGGDGGDGGGITICIGNPLTADGGDAGPAGFTVDAAALTQIDDELGGNATAFVDGPQWVDLDGGGYLAYSSLYLALPEIRRIQPDGGGRATLRTGTTKNYFIGSAYFDGGLYTVTSTQDSNTSGLVVTRPDGGQLTSLGVGGSTNPNDLVFGPKGDIYFTDARFQSAPTDGTGIYRRDTAGNVTKILSDTGHPNGIVMSLDGTKLYVGIQESNKILAYAVDAAGVITVAGHTDVATATDKPDGIAIDSGGNLWVAEAAANSGTKTGRVEVFSPTGTKLGEIPFADQRPTSVAFGGNDKKAVFITTEERIYRYSNRCAGTY